MGNCNDLDTIDECDVHDAVRKAWDLRGSNIGFDHDGEPRRRFIDANHHCVNCIDEPIAAPCLALLVEAITRDDLATTSRAAAGRNRITYADLA